VVTQLGGQPRALMLAGAMLGVLAIMPGLPFFPFALLSALLSGASIAAARLGERSRAEFDRNAEAELQAKAVPEPKAVNGLIRTSEIELMLGRQLTGAFMPIHAELAHRMAKIRRKFAQQYGFVIPEIRLSDDVNLAPRSYCVKVHGTPVANFELRPGEVLVIAGGRPAPDVPHDFAKEPAFGLDAYWAPEMFSEELRNAGYNPFDSASVMLTHLAEVIRNNLAQLLSYRDLRAITDTLEPEYKRLLDEITPALLSFSSLQAVLRMLLQERVSIRNLHLILEAIAEIASHSRKPEAVAEHVRMRIAQQICGDLGHNGALNVLRAGSRWDAGFLQALKRDPKGEIYEFDIDPKTLEQFADEASKRIKPLLEKGTSFAIATAPEARPYVRMILDRLFPNLPVLSHVEVAKAARLEILGSLS
jgi:flagellar biosynthesis protein FlhA